METELKIAGMSCGHCVNAVRQALAQVPGVEVKSVEVGRAVISTSAAAPKDEVKKALEEEGYRLEG